MIFESRVTTFLIEITLQINPLCASHIFQSIPVQPLETAASIFKSAFLANEDYSPEFVYPKKTTVFSVKLH